MNFSVELRNTVNLEAFSPLVRVIRYAGYKEDFPATQESFWILHRDMQVALRAGHPEWIYMDKLRVVMPQGEVVVPVDMRNTQFIGADVGVSHFSRGYEPEIMMCVDAFVPNDGVFVDVGANWGYFPVYLWSRAGFAGKCVAVEPSARAFNDLSWVLSALKLGENKVVAVRRALSDRQGKVSMSDELWTGNNAVVFDDEKTNALKNTSLVRCDTLDNLVSSNKLTALNLLKLDVEGAEASVIKGAKDTIHRFRPPIIFESWIGKTDAETFAAFVALQEVDSSYEFYLIVPDDLPSGRHFSGEIRRFLMADRLTMEQRINVLAVPREVDLASFFS